MSTSPRDAATELLAAASGGDPEAAERLFPIVYAELRAVAGRYLRRQRADHTLQPTALVHEAFLRLVGPERRGFDDRGHFVATAAAAMRQILVNHAKHKQRLKRGGGRARVTIAAVEPAQEPDVDLVALDDALTRLAAIDARQARIVELRFFAGLTVEETAAALDVSERTVHRDWTMARLWLRGELEERDDDDE